MVTVFIALMILLMKKTMSRFTMLIPCWIECFRSVRDHPMWRQMVWQCGEMWDVPAGGINGLPYNLGSHPLCRDIWWHWREGQWHSVSLYSIVWSTCFNLSWSIFTYWRLRLAKVVSCYFRFLWSFEDPFKIRSGDTSYSTGPVLAPVSQCSF